MKKVDSGEFYTSKQDNIFSEYKQFRAEEYYSSEFSKSPKEIPSYNESFENQGVQSTSEVSSTSDLRDVQKQYDKIRQSESSSSPDASFFLCKQLIDGYLDGVSGEYATPKCYFVDDKDVESFDLKFPPKRKLKLPGQLS